MAAPRMTGIRACVFDAYGTLFDVHSAVVQSRAVIGPKAEALSASWRAKQLQYTWLRSLMRRHADFWQVTGDALDFALAEHGIADPDLRTRLMESYLSLAPYPEVPACIAHLRQVGLATAILSNGTPFMLEAAVTSAGLGGQFDAILSVEAVGIYKPDPRVYQLAVDRLGLAATTVLFLSANGWDAHGARAFGLRVAWCNRFQQPDEVIPVAPDATIATLAELPGLLGL
ncbi:MAG: haloacid dehalogenase type II [Alphaproteobacteria bacterium]|nr:haloacid dehalogenase type II [Alphaproteobacteria bacterium]